MSVSRTTLRVYKRFEKSLIEEYNFKLFQNMFEAETKAVFNNVIFSKIEREGMKKLAGTTK